MVSNSPPIVSISKSSYAFTIVELLVVIVVIGVLAAITVVSYAGISQRAVATSLKSDLNNAVTQLKLDQVTNGSYPTALNLANGGKGIPSSPGTIYTYAVNNSAIPQTFCITARNSNTIYKVTDGLSPSPGGCLTDGVASGGLTLNMDAGNLASYSGAESTWLDFSDNLSNATLVNGATYDAANGGAVVFDGVGSYASIYAPNLSTVATVEIWAKLGTSYSSKMIFGWNTYDIYCNGGIGYNTAAGDVYGIPSANIASLNVVNNWVQYVFEMHSDVSYTNNKIYINGVLQTLSQIMGTESGGGRNFNGGNGRIATWIASSGYFMPMEVGVFRIYNRSLSQGEITQNFNAIRGRYGI